MALAQWFQSFITANRLPESFAEHAPKWFNPVADWLFDDQLSENETRFVGVNGSQGSGKSTCCDYLAQYLTHEKQKSVAVLSLDDFYYSKEKRAHLAETVHPLLSVRGVPGTHDLDLLNATLSALKDGAPVLLPRFNKATDNPVDKSDWPFIDKKVDVVLFEGWCWGVTAQSPSALEHDTNQLEQEQDPNGQWRRYVNSQLEHKYPALYQLMDHWVMLKAPEFACVSRWRQEQEAKLRAANPDKPGVMTNQQVDAFIQYFQRITEHALATLPQQCDLVFQLDEHRNINQCLGLPK